LLYIGIDVGGTFTDLVVFDVESGGTRVIKIPTTPANPETAILQALEEYQDKARDIASIIHATTIATNALITHRGLAETALITNEGFRDLLEIGRQRRPEIYSLLTRRPEPLVKRAHRFTVRGRILSDGRELEPLDTDSLRKISRKIVRLGFQSAAIAFLNSYVNPSHERQAERILREERFRGHTSLSSGVNREYREYERTSTTVVNSSLSSLVSTYLENLRRSLDEKGILAPLYVMNSNGGVSNVRYASQYAISIIESGPAAGILASKYLARILSIDKVITFDMGGTTAKAGTIEHGEPDTAYEFEAAGKTHSGRSIKGSGYPVRYPFLDLAEVSAGGGTVAWIDEGGALRVGPHSAAADPGPAAYGKGGSEPTVTDANIVLGRINPSYLLGGKMRIYGDLAFKAVEEKVAKKLGMDVYRASEGIVRLVNSSMSKAISIVSLERGRDPRDFVLFSFGGAGPLHACELAEEISIDRIVIPEHPGIFSAYGLLTVDMTREFSLPVMSTNIDPEPAFSELRKTAEKTLAEEGLTRFSFEELLDLRYKGQSFEITLRYTRRMDLRKAFDEKHRRIYGYSSPDPIELVNAKIKAIVPVEKISIQEKVSTLPRKRAEEASASRDVLFSGSFVKVPLYERETLGPGSYGKGPCIIEEYDSTTVVSPKWNWEVDGFGNILLKRG